MTTTADVINAADGVLSLREAVIAANGNAGDDAISLPAGTYLFSIAGRGENAAATGDLDITDTTGSLTITGAGATTTIIDAAGLDRVLHLLPGVALNLSDVSITGGSAPGSSFPTNSGGGILNFGTLTITNGTVSGNSASFLGGGVFNGGSATVFNATISGNSASIGGGIMSFVATLTVTNSTISSNYGTSGGGMFNQQSVETITNSTISDNAASSGGGLRTDGGTTTVDSSTITGNSAIGGGGIYVSSSTLALTNSTISGNTASSTGGGIDNETGRVTLTNSTVTANWAYNSGGIINRFDGTVRTKNSIIAANITLTFPDLSVVSATYISLGNNLIGDVGNAAGFTNGVNGDQVGGGGNPVIDPKLGPLQDNGGPTFTHALLSSSPAIDAGTNLSAPATDQRGVPRPQDGNGDGIAVVDIGAYELVPTPAPDTVPPTISASVTPAPNANGWNNTDVTVSFICIDAESGVASCPAPVSVTIEGANQPVTGTAVDQAGNSVSVTVGINIDKTAPTTTVAVSPAPNAAGWHKTDITVSLSADDNLSGVELAEFSLDGGSFLSYGGSTTVTISTEGMHTLQFRSLDKAGNAESTQSLTLRIDKTPPSITAAVSPAPNANGWHNTDVTLRFSCSDGLSGLASCPSPMTVTVEGQHMVTGTAVDVADNMASVALDVFIDKTPPDTALVSAVDGSGALVPNGGSTASTSMTFNFAAADNLSDPASFECSLDGATFSTCTSPTSLTSLLLGTHTFEFRAIDKADNVDATPESFTWNVVNTPTGSNIVTQPVDTTTGSSPVTLTFSTVTQAGITSLTTSSSGPPPPTGFKLGTPATYYELTTTATVSGPIEVCIDYSGISFKGKEENLRLRHFEDTNSDGTADTWVDRTILPVDTTNHIICASVASLSLFAIFEPENQPPVANAGGPYTIHEGGSLTLDASGSSDPDGDALTFSWDVNGDSTFGDATGASPTLSWSQLVGLGINDGPSTFTVTVQLDDGNGGVAQDSATLSVLNVPPVITAFSSSSPGCGGAAEGQEITVSGSFVDAGVLDTHTALINWGDGTTSTAAITEADGAGSLAASHVYGTGGVYTITVTLSDDDGDSDDAMAPALITGAGINGGVLQVVGTDLADNVTVNMQDASTFKVQASFLATAGNQKTFAAASVGKILVLLCGGNDQATVSSGISITAHMDGGAGNDHLKGGSGHDIMLGGEGDDLLVGGVGRDLMIGGNGADRIVGDPGDDILIAGTTAFDANDVALAAILAEWTSDRDYATRTANLRGVDDAGGNNFENRLNLDFFLKTDGAGATVSDDGAKDVMTGSAGQDWFFANLDSGVLDKITDLSAAEFADDLDFILLDA